MKQDRGALTPSPPLANARALSPQAMPGRTLMASKNYAFGSANDGLTQICCPGFKAIGSTGRELRRSKERRTWKITPEMRAVVGESGKNWNKQPIQKRGFA